MPYSRPIRSLHQDPKMVLSHPRTLLLLNLRIFTRVPPGAALLSTIHFLASTTVLDSNRLRHLPGDILALHLALLRNLQLHHHTLSTPILIPQLQHRSNALLPSPPGINLFAILLLLQPSQGVVNRLPTPHSSRNTSSRSRLANQTYSHDTAKYSEERLVGGWCCGGL